jgi:hypothetical protein
VVVFGLGKNLLSILGRCDGTDFSYVKID